MSDIIKTYYEQNDIGLVREVNVYKTDIVVIDHVGNEKTITVYPVNVSESFIWSRNENR